MEKIIEELKKMQCDVEGAMERFLDDYDLYGVCLESLVSDPSFVELGVALSENDAEKAFENAHTLKGIIGNMGLTPMLKIVEQIVEPLRKGELDGLMPLYDQLILENKKIKALIG
ncbi:MAG: Hpt domain-containing protein [Anaerovoracaceae bacterium]